MGQQTQRYRVDTDHGSYEVEVEMGGDSLSGTSVESAPTPTGFAQNAVTSAGNLLKGAAEGLWGAATTRPDTTIANMAGGLKERAMEYVHDLHPMTAMEQAGEGNLTGALSNLLPVELMYRDPVGVGADALGVEGLVKGGLALKNLPGKIKAKRARAFNEKPLASQMDKLPERPGPERMRTGGPVASPSAGINDLPLASQMEMLPSHGGTPSARVGNSPILAQAGINDLPLASQMDMLPTEGGVSSARTGTAAMGPQGNINSLPLFEQQRILEQTGGNRPVIDTGRRGADLPPSRDVAPPTGIAEELGVSAQSPLDNLSASINGRGIDLSKLPEAARQRILEQLDPSRRPMSRPAPAVIPPREVPAAPVKTSPARRPAPSVPEDRPMNLRETRRMEGAASAAQDPRFLELAKEFGLNPTAATVNDLTGALSRVPLSVEVGPGTSATEGLDRGFTRRLGDERGFINPDLIGDLPRLLEAMIAGYALRGKIPMAVAHGLNKAGAVIPPAVMGAGAARLNHP